MVWHEGKNPECHRLAIQASSGKRQTPSYNLMERASCSLAMKPSRFWEVQSEFSSPANTTNNTSPTSSPILDKVDKTPVTRKQKLFLYKAGICSRLNWNLSILELSISWVSSTLECKATHYLKRWSGLARSADPSCLYLPKDNGRLQLPPTSLQYEKLRSPQAALLLTSRNPLTRYVTTMEIQREQALQGQVSTNAAET